MGNKDYSSYIFKSYNKKKEDEEKNQNSSQSNLKDYSYVFKKHNLSKTINLDTLETDINTLAKTIQSVYDGWQTEETLNNTRSSIEALQKRVNAYQEYRKTYGTKDSADLTELSNNYKSMLEGWDDLKYHYSKYKNADDYKKALAESEAYQKELDSMPSADLKAVQTEIDGLQKILDNANALKPKTNVSTTTKKGKGAIEVSQKRDKEQKILDEYLKSVGYTSVEEIEKALGEKKVYKNKAQRVQDGIKLSSVADKKSKNYDPNFDNYSAKGTALGNEETDEWYISGYKNQVAYLRNNPDVLEQYFDTADDNGVMVESILDNQLPAVAAKYMEEDEAKLHDYYVYLENQGLVEKGTATKYLRSIEEELKQRQGKDVAAERKSLFSKYTFGHKAGIDQFTQGMINAFNTEDDYIPATAIQNASAQFREDIDKAHGTFGQGVYDLITTTSNMVPSILASSVSNALLPGSGAVVGATLMGTSAAGNSYQQMLNQGYDKSQARTYATLVGISEAGLQYAFGGIGKLGGKLTSKSITAIANGVDNALGRFAIKYGMNMAAEGFEEAAQEVLNPFFENLAVGYSKNDLTDVNWGEVAYSGVLGALSAGFLEGGSTAVSTFKENSVAKKTGANIRTNNQIEGMLDIASLSQEESNAYDLYTHYAKNGVNAENISDLQLGRLHSMADADAQSTLNSRKSTAEEKASAKNTLYDLAIIKQNRSAQNLGKDAIKELYGNEEGTTTLIEEGLESGENTESHKLAIELKAKVDAGETITEVELANLADANTDAYKGEVKADAEARLTELGETNATKLAQIVAKKTNGELLTTAERETLQKSKNATRVYNEINNEDLVSTTENMSEGEANLILSTYDDSISVDSFMNSYNLVKSYATNRFTDDYVLEHRGKLTPSQASAIYTHFVTDEDAKTQKMFDDLKVKHRNAPFQFGSFNDSVIDYNNSGAEGKVNWNDLNDDQKKAIAIVSTISQQAGMDIELAIDGEERGFNGYFEISKNKITIDVFAGMDKLLGKNMDNIMLPILSHELTHWMEELAPELYRKYSDYVMETLVETTGHTEQYILDARLKKLQENHPGQQFTYDYVKREVIARASEDMLAKSETIQGFVDTLSTDEKKTFIEKIKDILRDIKKWFNSYLERVKSNAPEAKAIREASDRIDEQIKMWDAMLKSAIETNQALQNEGVSVADFIQKDAALHELQFNERLIEKHKDMIANNYSEDAEIDLDTLMARYNKVIDIWQELGGELNSQFLEEWNNKEGKDRAFTIFKKQSGYKYNVELSSMCKKGIALFEAIDTIVKQEVMRQLNTKTLGKAEKEILYDILKQNYEIPCAICYVEQARQREGDVIDAFLNGKIEKTKTGKVTTYKLGWNETLANIQAEMQKMGVNYTFPALDRSVATDNYTPADISMDEATQEAFFGALKKIANAEIRRYNKEAKKNRPLITKTDAKSINETFKGQIPLNLRVFKTMFTEPSSRFTIADDLLYSSMTTLNLANNHSGLYGVFNQQGGVGGYKTKQGAMVYWGDILKKSWKPSTLRDEGGVRNQSNSDFMMYTLLDHAQMYVDFTAKGYYLQAYTKVLAELKLFGLSKGKINASLIPKVVEFKNADGSVDIEKTRENAGLDEQGNPIYDDFEGINHTEAFMLLEDAEYSKSIGGVCIGYSDKHILKLLDDNRIQLIIGFHDKTNDPTKRYRGAVYAKNYNEVNEAAKYDSKGELKTVHIGFNQFVRKAENKFKTKDTINYKGKTYNKNDIPRLAADLYLEHCESKGFLPAYSRGETDFSKHPNYYKLLADFSLYDINGNYAPHQKVEYNMPDQVPFLDKNGNKAYMPTKDYIKKELEKELSVRDSLSEALADKSENGVIPQFVKKVNELYSKDTQFADRDTVDSLGNKLSEGQMEYFKDSKVRDEKGRLIPVYHGSKSAGFTEFTKSDEIGYFFARNIKTSRTYAGGSKAIYAPDKNSPEFSGAANYKVYLDIKKPYIIDGNGANWNQLEANGERVDISIKSQKWNNGSGIAKIQFKYNGKTYSQTVRTSEEFESFISKHTNPEMAKAFAYAMGQAVDKNGKGEFNAGFIWDFKNSVQGDTKNTRDIVRKAYNSHWNYDGVIFKNVVDSGDGSKIKADDLYVVFDSNQIKSVNNTNPTENKDIRYADRDTAYMDAVESGDMETAQRMVDEAAEKAGYTINAYHGTPDSRNLVYNKITGSIDVKGDFSIFDSSKSRADRVDGSAFFFTNNEKVAKFYSPEQGYKPKVYNSKLKIVNPLFVECNGANWNEIPFDKLAYSYPTPNGGVKTTNKVTTKDIAQYARENGYDGVVFENIIDGKADTSENIGTVYAVFSSNQIKSADPVTYDDKGKVIPLSQRFNKANDDIRYADRDTAYAPTFYSKMGKTVDEMKQDKIGANSVISYLKGRGVKDEEIKWSGIETFLEGKKSVTKAELQEFIAGSQLQIEENVLGKDTFKEFFDAMSDATDIHITRQQFAKYIQESDGEYNKIAQLLEWTNVSEEKKQDVLSKYKKAVENFGKDVAKWEEYKLDGGENYREITFKMPNSTYTNGAMQAHWGVAAEGILAHARLQDFNIDGKKMLFIEEIQSDWHNEGHKSGYESEEYTKAAREEERIRNELSGLAVELRKAYDSPEETNLREKKKELEKKLRDVILKRKTLGVVDAVPDAPFKETYHEYVLKRLIRMAAEEGYDSIGWTTADIQSERWSDDFAEGYRIEYDQDIPKFLKKYGKQWGATVGKTFLGDETQEKVSYVISTEEGINGQYYSTIEEAVEVLVEQSNEWWGTEFSADSVDIDEWDDVVRVFDEETGDEIGTLHTEYGTPDSQGVTEVWSMDITDQMKNSVLYEGQVMYADRDSLGNELSEEQAEFFKDSKVRDKNGNLLVVRHGTSEDFHIFDFAKSGKNGKVEGYGFYFSDDKEITKMYGEIQKEVYLNITKPMYNNKRTIKKAELIKFVNALIDFDTNKWDTPWQDSFMSNYINTYEFQMSRRYAVQQFVNQIWEYNTNDQDLIFEIAQADGRTYENSTMKEFYDVLTESIGYDGIIAEWSHADGKSNVYVTFNSEQSKYTNNTTPTSNPDMRFADRDEVDVYKLMGENERLVKENENFKADIERLKERLKIEKQVTHGNYFNENQINAVAGHLRKIAKTTYDKVELMKQLKDLYSYIAHTEELSWEDVFSKSYSIAKNMLTERKEDVIVNDYFKDMLKDFRTTPISLNEKQIGDAKHLYGNDYHRFLFQKFKITKDGKDLDKVWKENWAPKYGFDTDISDTEIVSEMYKKYLEAKEGAEIVAEYNEEETARWLANEIYNQYWNVSPIRTTADKYDKRIKQLNAEHRNAMRDLRDNYNNRIAEQKKADREKYQERYKKLAQDIRERKDKEIAEVKKLGQERMAKYKENAERKTKIQSITSNSLTLNKWLTTNSKDYHIHENMKAPVIALLQAIDFSSKRMLDKNYPTKQDVYLSKALSKVKDMMADATNLKEGLESLYGHDMDEELKALVESVDNIMRTVGDNEYVLNRMSLEELKTLDKLVRTIKQTVTKLNKFHTVHHNKGIVNLAHTFMAYGDKLGKIKKQDGRIAKHLKFRNCTPYYYFKRLGEAGELLFEAFQDGWDKLAFNSKQIIDFTNEVYTNKEVQEWTKATKKFTFDINGESRSFEMSIAQIMALHCVAKQEDAQRHLLSGGMTLSRLDKKGNVVADYENIPLGTNEVFSILATLTDRQKEVADKLQEFMNTVCSDWGNEISMARFGVNMFGMPDYFPIKVSPTTIPTDNTKEFDNASLFRLLNMSFTKSRNEYANQSIEIGDIFDIFAQHTTDMAKYNALALPVLDFNKFYSIKGKDDITNVEYGVDRTLRTVYGNEAVSYVKRFVRDINGSQNVSRDAIGKTFFKNAKVAAVAANLRVVLLQPTAFFKASAVLDNKYLLKAGAYMKVNPISMKDKYKKAIAKAEKYCGIAQWKALGYYDTDISKGIAEKVKHLETFKDKAIEKSLKGAELADKLTFGTLWTACEFEIRDTRKDLEVGSEEFNQAIAKRLREVIYATQVVDSTMTRTDMMRSSDTFDKMLTTFGSEPAIAYNMLMDMVMQYSQDKKTLGKEEAKKKNGKKIRKVIAAYTITNVVAALVESGFDAYRDDDDDEEMLEQFMVNYLKNFSLDMSIGNKLPYIKEAYSVLQGYSSSRMDTQWMEYVYGTLTANNFEKFLKNGLKLGSNITGFAFYNLYRDLMATLYNLDILDKEDIEDLFS